MKKSDEIVLAVGHLSISEHLPTTFGELHKIIWDSFNLGREYELQLQKEIEP